MSLNLFEFERSTDNALGINLKYVKERSLKTASLSRLMTYLFPEKLKEDYFTHLLRTHNIL